MFLPGHPEFPGEQMERLRVRFREMLTERAANPTGDIISAIATAAEDGEPLSLDIGESMMNALVFGGFDTTVSSAAFGLQYLEQHREHIPRIAEDAQFRSNAIEELLRMHAPATGTSRTALKDTELLGVPIKKGERVLMWFAGATATRCASRTRTRCIWTGPMPTSTSPSAPETTVAWGRLWPRSSSPSCSASSRSAT